MIWELSHRGDQRTRIMADRHYNRQKPGTSQFVPPGRCLVLVTEGAFWVTSWPFAKFVKHRWPGAWICSAFRRESSCRARASDLILEALAATRWRFGEPHELGLVTFIDKTKVQPIITHGKQTWGRTWLLAGFEPDGQTQGGLLAFRISADRIPAAQEPMKANRSFEFEGQA